MKKSQNEKILKHLLAGNSITSLTALSKFGCLRLASRISDIKEMCRGGIEVELSTGGKLINFYLVVRDCYIKHNGKRYKKYWIE